MKIQLYADGSNVNQIIELYKTKNVHGFTTNPTLMAKEKIIDYLGFINTLTSIIKDLPISFEVLADDLNEMESQARKIASCSHNIYVKIPITNCKGESTKNIIRSLLNDGINVNVTAVFTERQVYEILSYIYHDTSVILSVFAGRIADTGLDPKPIMKIIKNMIPRNVKLLWASCREVYNIYEADEIGCHIVTATHDLINKLKLKGKDLEAYSLETVKMFYDDAIKSGITL